MAKRKYLSIVSLIITLNIISLQNAYSSAYLPEPGHYKYFINFTSIDKDSRKKRDYRASIFIKIEDLIFALLSKQQDIKNIALKQNRSITDMEMHDIQSLELDIKKLENDSKEIKSFNDDIYSSCEIEYGIMPNQSFGLKIEYKIDRFAQTHNSKTIHKTTHIGKEIESFYKYKLYQNDSIIVTLQPKLHYSLYDNYSSYNVDLGLFLGHSRTKKDITNFQEFGVLTRKKFNKRNNLPFGYIISILEGVRFKNGVIISNYTQYEKQKSINPFHRNMIYNQISVAKEIYFDSLKVQNLTAQIGYFWKGSTASPVYTNSGPVFSLWCNL